VKRPWFVVTLAALAGVAGGLIAIIGGFLTAWHCSSGDGGVPFVSPESQQADVCSWTGDGIGLIVLGIAAASGLAVAAYRLGRGWIAGARSPLAFAALTLAAALAPIALIWAANLPSDECTDETAQAYDAWAESGARGEPPADCATY